MGWDAIPAEASRWIASRLARSPEFQPACVSAAGLIHNWAVMAHAGEVTHLDMLKARQAQCRVTAAAHQADKWRLVTGPAGAFA
eukprot:9440591-Pyramimonas_sp.AAC.1